LPIKFVRRFIKLESAGGIVLFSAAVLALIISNTPLHHYYQDLLKVNFSIHFGDYGLSKPLILWINDGMMTIFFLLVGLEIKRELFVGELNSLAKVALPGIAAIGGMVGPALIYIMFNMHDPNLLRGWAIPTATDIAFSLGVIYLLGTRVPLSLKIFLTALAIFDDIGAIIIIAAFYTAKISMLSLIFAAVCLLVLLLMNRLGVKNLVAYFFVGIILWLCVLQSGVHATLAGVALAFAIPLKDRNKPSYSPLRSLEEKLHPWVAFFVLPVFGFANAGISFSGLRADQLLSSMPLGIAAGLFFGKQLGIFATVWLAIKMGFAKMPTGANWLSIYAIGLICGIGFTMSLFIGTLAFDEMGGGYVVMVRIGVLAGSFLSGVLGYMLLRKSCVVLN